MIRKVLGWLFVICLLGGAAWEYGRQYIPGYLDNQCKARWSGQGASAKFQSGAGCAVLVNGAWVPEADMHLQLVFPAERPRATPSPTGGR
jgi:hypothetical protein